MFERSLMVPSSVRRRRGVWAVLPDAPLPKVCERNESLEVAAGKGASIR